MIELPHITAYIRRLRRLSARPTISISGGWLVLVLATMVFQQQLDNVIGCFVTLGIVISGKFAIYWVVAETMAGLSREGRSAAPAWYLTPLSNTQAMAGTVLSAMLAIIPPLAGLYSYLPLHAQIWVEWYGITCPGFLMQHGCDAMTLDAATWQFMLHLPLFALFAGCLQLALRHLAYAPLLPFILALSATLSSMWEAGAFRQPQLSGVYTTDWIWAIVTVSLGLLFFTIMLYLLKWCAECDSVNPLHGVLQLWALALPLVAGLSATSALVEIIFIRQASYRAQVYNYLYNGIFMPLHAQMALFQPDMPVLAPSHTARYWLCLYGWPLFNPGAVVAYMVLLAASAGMLWHIALHCLDVARNPAKRLDLQMRRQTHGNRQ